MKYYENEAFSTFVEELNYDHLIDQLVTCNRIHVIHDKDPDGYASCAVLYAFLEYVSKSGVNEGCVITSEAMTHGMPFQTKDYSTIPDCDLLVILDNAVKASLLSKIAAAPAKSILVIDHHPDTAEISEFDECYEKKFLYVLFSEDWSTTALTDALYRHYAHEYDEDGMCAHLVAVIDTFDRWTFRDDEAWNNMVRAFTAASFHYGLDNVPWYDIVTDKKGTGLKLFNDVVKKGDSVREFELSTAQNIAKTRVTKSIVNVNGKRLKCAIAYHTDFYNVIGVEVMRMHPEVDFVVIATTTNDPVLTHRAYIRSRTGKANAAEVANLLGGGGGVNASGAFMTAKTFYDFFFNPSFDE